MFENILGQQKAKDIISKQIKSGKIAHAYIFMGQGGVGRRLMAVEFAKILNCVANDFSKTNMGACGKCASCVKITKGIHPDLHFIDFAKQAELEDDCFEKQKVLKINTIRYMQKETATKTHEGKWKVFIVEPAEKINTAGTNSLLKTLEEPSENTVIILIAKHKETLPQTIISRVQTVFFRSLGQNEIVDLLTLNYSIDTAKARETAELSEGSVEIAKKLIEKNGTPMIFLWREFKKRELYISEVLKLSKDMAKNGALECIDAMMAEVKKDFRANPQIAASVLESLINSRALLLKNVNAQMVLDNLFFCLSDKMNHLS